MNKIKPFTMTEAIVIFVALAFFAVMLFPTFGSGCRKAPSNNSMNQAKQIMTGIAAYFSDVKNKTMPKIEDAFTADEIGSELFTCPAGAGDLQRRDYGYASKFGFYNIIDNTDPAFAQATLKEIDSSFLWQDINNESSPIITTANAFEKTESLQPVAFGDGHAEVAGQE